MAYGKKYILSFISDRGNDYKVEVLQQGFSGAAVVKSFGSAPMLNIEDGDGRVKGSSLAFSIQADTEGELSGLYTTNNKEYKVVLYRNNAIYWQGYLLPELYSENYVDPPYDVAVTATDQLATLKDVAYQGEDELKSLLDIVKGILLNTKVDIPCKIHMQLNNAQGSLLSTSYISAAAYNGQSCYDVLNAILLSCNCSIMQMGNEWVISSYTDATTTYITDNGSVNIPHCTIGQMGKADVCPDGSLTMVNAPALKGATVEYNHILRNSMLLNADCSSKVHWMYLPTELNANYPSETELLGTVYKNYFWYLYQKNLKNNNSLQLWQDVSLNTDTENTYSLSVKAIFTGAAEMLLVRIMYTSEFDTKWYLTNDGWKTDVNTYDVNSYIQITGQSKGYGVTILELSDKSKYETTTIRFNLPDVPGTLRVGFINSMSEDRDGSAAALDAIAVTDVYLVIDNVTGKTSTTLVESNATTAQEQIGISYGEAVESANADKIDLSYLRYSDGQRVESVVLSGREYPSYYLAMVQDLSRYYGVKKMQLQGALMGTDVLHPIYKDVFSSKVLRLVSGQYNLLDDSVSISLEEVPTAFVDYTLTVYAKENAAQNTTTSASGSVAVSGGDTYFGLQADGDIFVKGDRSLTGKEGRFDNLALPSAAPAGVSANKTYIYSSDPAKLAAVDMVELVNNLAEKATKTDLTALATTVGGLADTLATEQGYIDTLQGYFENGVAKKATADALGNVITDTYATKVALNAVDERVKTLEALGLTLEVKDGVTYVKSKYSFYTLGGLASGEPSSSGGGGGTVGGSNVSFKAELLSGTKIGTITIDNVATNIYAPSALANPYPLIINGVTYDGSAPVNVNISGGTADSIAWDAITGKPSLVYYNTNIDTNTLANSVNKIGYGYATGGWYESGPALSFGVENYQFQMQMRLSAETSSVVWRPVQGGTKFTWRHFLDAYNYSNYALPKSGGTIENTAYGALVISRKGTNGFSAIAYQNTTDGILGYIGIGGSGSSYPYQPTLINNDGTFQIIHSGNIGSYAPVYNSNGNVLIGTTTDVSNYKLGVNGGGIFSSSLRTHSLKLGNSGVNAYGWNSDWYYAKISYVYESANPDYLRPAITFSTMAASYEAGTEIERMRICSDGNVSIGYAGNGGAKLYVAGNFEATGGVASRQPSDRRLKENICTISTTDAISVLRKLNPIFFKWNALATSLDSRNTGNSVGFIADEYESLIVNSGRDIWEKYRAIDYTKAIPYLAKGWQIHDAILVKHADNIEDLRSRVEVLERENRELKQRLNMRA